MKEFDVTYKVNNSIGHFTVKSNDSFNARAIAWETLKVSRIHGSIVKVVAK